MHVRAVAAADAADAAVQALQTVPKVAHVVRQRTADGREELITADLPPSGVDLAFTVLLAAGLEPEHISVERVNRVGPVERPRGTWLGHQTEAMVWAEVVEGARDNARLPARYLMYMSIAGTLAAFAVLLQNPVLLVGAMAVSPDLLPVTSACVGLVAKRPHLFGRAVGTLAIGLAVAFGTALLLTKFLSAVGYLSSKALPSGTSLILPPKVSLDMVTIAFVSGIAGMVAAETRASAAVGVAISVTTIPAAAYAGVAAVIGETDQAIGALTVLAVNVLFLLIGGTLTLIVQDWLRRRSARPPR